MASVSVPLADEPRQPAIAAAAADDDAAPDRKRRNHSTVSPDDTATMTMATISAML